MSDAVPPSVDLPVPARVLAVGAHPDDIEFGCGATLAKWSAAGAEVHLLVLHRDQRHLLFDDEAGELQEMA